MPLPRRDFLKAGALGAGAALAGLPAHAAGGRRPNLLLVTTDDLGLQLSCYGEKRFATPRLDAFAAQGVRFENFYIAQPSCSSSRSALLTGWYPHQSGQYGLSHLGFSMRPGLPNLPALLKGAGYRTGIIGKLHVAPEAEYPWDWMPQPEKMAAVATRKVRWVAEQSKAFFESAKAEQKPFFYYVNFFDPHGPYSPDVAQVEGLPEKPFTAETLPKPYPLKSPTEEAVKRNSAVIANTILRADAGMGLLLDALEASGLAENTLVVFLGDNGLPVIRGKGTCYESGVHVPLMVRWPGVWPRGQVSQTLVEEVDLVPTLLSAAGVGVPKGLPGADLGPLLTGKKPKWREHLFTEMNFHEPQMCRPERTVRDARYKLLHHLAPIEEGPPVELFDLQADPGELKNLAEEQALAPVRKALEAALLRWRKETGDPLLDPERVKRWVAAGERWGKMKAEAKQKAFKIPEGEVKLLD